MLSNIFSLQNILLAYSISLTILLAYSISLTIFASKYMKSKSIENEEDKNECYVVADPSKSILKVFFHENEANEYVAMRKLESLDACILIYAITENGDEISGLFEY